MYDSTLFSVMRTTHLRHLVNCWADTGWGRKVAACFRRRRQGMPTF